MKIVVAGAGAWGTALAIGACAAPAAHQVTLWGRDAAQVAAMQALRRNQRYLPQSPLPESLALSAAPLAPLAADSDLVIIGTPMAALRATLAALADLTVPVAWLCKGFERVADADAGQGLHGLLAHEIAEQVAPRLAVGTLSGPSFAREVAEAKPTALVAASQQASVRQALVDGGTMRVVERQVGRLAWPQRAPQQALHPRTQRLATDPHNPHRATPRGRGNRDDGVVVTGEHKKPWSEGESKPGIPWNRLRRATGIAPWGEAPQALRGVPISGVT